MCDIGCRGGRRVCTCALRWRTMVPWRSERSRAPSILPSSRNAGPHAPRAGTARRGRHERSSARAWRPGSLSESPCSRARSPRSTASSCPTTPTTRWRSHGRSRTAPGRARSGAAHEWLPAPHRVLDGAVVLDGCRQLDGAQDRHRHPHPRRRRHDRAGRVDRAPCRRPHRRNRSRGVVGTLAACPRRDDGRPGDIAGDHVRGAARGRVAPRARAARQHAAMGGPRRGGGPRSAGARRRCDPRSAASPSSRHAASCGPGAGWCSAPQRALWCSHRGGSGAGRTSAAPSPRAARRCAATRSSRRGRSASSASRRDR